MRIKESWSKSERRKRAKSCDDPQGFTMRQFCRNQRTRSGKGEMTNEELLRQLIREGLASEDGDDVTQEFSDAILRLKDAHDDFKNQPDNSPQQDAAAREIFAAYSDIADLGELEKLNVDINEFEEVTGMNSDDLNTLFYKDPINKILNDRYDSQGRRKAPAAKSATQKTANTYIPPLPPEVLNRDPSIEREPFVPEWEKTGWGPSDPFPWERKK